MEGNSYYSIGTVCDKDGNVFLTGETNSTDGIATPNSFQPLKAAAEDVFIAKFNSSGVRQWGTYLGGDGVDYAYSICADTLGGIFVVGNTTSNTGFATAGSNQSGYAGGTDGFVAKLNTIGTLQWLTYFGANGYDNINAVQSDNSGNCYIVGITDNISNIATTGSFQPVYGGGPSDGFFAKLNPQGQLVWSTYYGGNDIDEATSLAISQNNDIFVSGYSISPTGIATSGAYMDTLYNSTSECFLAKFDSMGQRYWATYYGGSGYETYSYVTTSDAYNLYLLGMTNSAEGISNQLSYQPNYGGGDADAFLTHFDLCEPASMPVSILGDTIVCSSHGYTYHIDSVPGAVSYSWFIPNGWLGSSDSTNIDLMANDTSGIIYVVANNYCANSDSVSLHITVLPSPQPELVQNGNILSTTIPYNSYQWNFNDQPINGANASTFIVNANGDYSVTVSNENGCSGTSDTIHGSTGIENIPALGQAIKIYPNPTTGVLFISSPIPTNYQLKAMDGRELLSGKSGKGIDINNLSSGLYFLQIYDNNGTLIKNEKVIKAAK